MDKKTIVLTESQLRKVINESIARVLKDEKSKATCLKEDVMRRFYGITSNGHKPMLCERINLDRIIKKHGRNGYIIISANRSDESEERNTEHTKMLYDEIKKSGYSYLPAYGGYRGTDGVEDDFEPSFLVFNYDTKGNSKDFSILYNLALKWCGEHEQESVMIKAPNEPPKHINADGYKVNDFEGDRVWKNDKNQMFFTSMKPRNEIDPDNPSRRFTLDIGYGKREDDEELNEGIYINPAHCTLNERQRRHNEIFLS